MVPDPPQAAAAPVPTGESSQAHETLLVLQLHRLLKVSLIHAIDNQAVVQQIERTVQTLETIGEREPGSIALLFAKNTVFVGGNLLKATRTEYDSALELGEMLRQFDITEVAFHPDLDASDLAAFVQAFASANHDSEARSLLRTCSPKVLARSVDLSALLEEEEDLTDDERIVRTYASAVVVMRRVFENLERGQYSLPHQAKRIAQKLVLLSEGDTPAYLGVTAMRNANHDAAGRAVNTAILAVAMSRQLTRDLGVMARIAMSALFFDVGRPLLLEVTGMDKSLALAVADLTEQAPRQLAATTALVLTALGGFRSSSAVRTVVTYEAHRHRHAKEVGPLYGGKREPTVAARIVAIAHRFNHLLTPDPAASRFCTPDRAIALLKREAQDDVDRSIIGVLVGAIGMFPTGTAVRLNTGEQAVVTSTPLHPADAVTPVVRLVYTAQGARFDPTVDVDLREDASRQIATVITEPDEQLLAAGETVFALEARPSMRLMPDHSLRRPTTIPPPSRAHRQLTGPDGVDTAGRAGANEGAPPPTLTARGVPPCSSTSVDCRPLRFPLVTTPAGAANGEELPGVPATPVRVHGDPATGGGLDATLAEPAPRIAAARIQPPPAVPDLIMAEEEPDSGVSSLIAHDLAASATGSLDRTPLAHLIVYFIDKGLSGSMVFTSPTPGGKVEHGLHVTRGAPDKACTATRVAPMGPLLHDAGVGLPQSVSIGPMAQVGFDEAAIEKKILEGGRVGTAVLTRVRSIQLRERIIQLFGLPPETEYAFYADLDLLETRWGTVPGQVLPLALLADGIRAHHDAASVDSILARLGSHPFCLLSNVDIDGFGFTAPEQKVVATIASTRVSFPELEAAMDPVAARVVVYVLFLTRSIDVGTKARPPIRNP